MTTLRDNFKKRLSKAWRADPNTDPYQRPNLEIAVPDRGFVRVPLVMMDGRSIVDHSAGRQVFKNWDGKTYVSHTDAERQALEDARLNHKRHLSNAWKKMRSARRDEAEEDALASAGLSKSAPNQTGDAIADARAAYHHQLETAYLNGGTQ